MNNHNYLMGGTISALLFLITKLLIIILAIVVIAGVITWIRDNFIKNNNSKLMKDINNDPVLKSVAVITCSIIGLVIFFSILNSLIHPGTSFDLATAVYSPTLGMSGVLMILIRVLMCIFIVSLVLAAIVYFKNQYESGNLNLFSNKPNQSGNMINNVDYNVDDKTTQK